MSNCGRHQGLDNSNYKSFALLSTGGPVSCGLSEQFSILWTHDKPLVNSRRKIFSLCGFRVKSFQPRHVSFRLKLVILFSEYIAKAET
ncbi:unnamed protein product [Spirodela intermedia]|uniref:Uncharacterized protein n=1 Tax=Spirodela intermedia TaxID=51605 RepID=A0A7I8JAS9_SPIIN|nr:unnamed protein product [Spirodela intermedia]CAA6667081.1 unnamed protein product [Spirodela intermedia]